MTRWLSGFALVVALLILYVPHVREATFVYEDDRSLAAASPDTWVKLLSGRGLTNQSWQTIRTPQGSHAVNLALHLVNVLLVGLLGWRLTGRSWIGLGLAGLFALHPLTTESVAYATSRSELLAALGVLAALLCATARSVWWGLAVPVCLAVAYAGKETGLIGLAILPGVLWVRGERLWAELLAWIGVATAVTIAAIAGPAIAALGGEIPSAPTGPIGWALVQASAVWRLVLLSVWPAWLSVTPDVPPSLWLGLGCTVLLAALAETAWRARRHAPLFTVGVLCCALVAAPRFLVRTPLNPFNEHQWYLAVPGVACALLGLIDLTCRRWACRSSWRWA